MEEIKPKKERKFLKTMGEVALTLVRELLLNVGKKLINKSGNKRQGLVLAFIILASTFAIAQYPSTGNKQRLGYQTTGDGLVFRGRASDTTALKPFTINNAYHLFDTLNNVLFSYIKTKGGWKFNNSDTVIIQGVTMPFDSITFNTAKDGTVGVGEVEYNDTQGSLIQGLKGGLVTNVIGQQLHQRVNNRTGATLNKGDVVYLSGSQGNRITVAKAIATSDPTSANTFGIVAEQILNNASGYIITEGLITNINTSALTQDSAVYLSGITAGALTSTKPQAPIHGVYIGVCVKANAGSGEVFVKIRNEQELDELHDVQISNPINNASLYFKSSEGLWRDTTAALLVSDTSSMLTNYLRNGVAANTYLPLTGGTLSGTLNGTNLNLSTGLDVNGNFTNNLNSNISALFRGYQIILAPNSDYEPTRIHFPNRPINFTFSNYGSGIRHKWGESDARNSFISLYTSNPFNLQIDAVSINSSGDVGIKDTTPSFTLDVNGTLGVTGATTLSNLDGIGSRMVIAGSGGLLSTQAIPTGTVTSVGGTGTVNGISLSGTVTSSGNLTLGGTLSGVSLSSQVTGTLPIANGGTGATTQSAARTALGATVRGSNTFILPDLSAISFLRYNADNTVSQRAADGMRTDLGGTTIGQSMFTLTNPSAIRFPRFNADNTVSALDAATFRTAIGAGTGDGNGTVTSVSINPTNPNGLTVATGTTTPVISMALAASGITGVVSATTQQFSGAKTFLGDINGNSALTMTGFSTLTGGASVGTLATTSSLTRVLGINSSNAIGELSLGTGMSVGSGVLSVQAAGPSQTGLVTSLTQTFGGNKTFNGTVTLASASGTATSVIGRSSTGQVVDLTLGSGLSLSGGTLNISQQNFNGYLASTSTSITLITDYGLVEQLYLNINQGSTVSITLPTASLNNGMAITIKNRGTGAVNSNANNIQPLNSSSLDAIILLSGGGKFTTLVSDGTNWIKMTGN